MVIGQFKSPIALIFFIPFRIELEFQADLILKIIQMFVMLLLKLEFEEHWVAVFVKMNGD